MRSDVEGRGVKRGGVVNVVCCVWAATLGACIDVSRPIVVEDGAAEDRNLVVERDQAPSDTTQPDDQDVATFDVGPPDDRDGATPQIDRLADQDVGGDSPPVAPPCPVPDQIRCDGVCVDIRSSIDHCGRCGNACPREGTGLTHVRGAWCDVGVCRLTCDPNFADCDVNFANGCEVDTQASSLHCGACGTACRAYPNALPWCDAGSCRFVCNGGFENCDASDDTGCETDPQTSTAHCGRCGNACPTGANAAPSCAAGRCGLVCNTGFADCDMNPANGCEIDTRTSTAHCNHCGNVCLAAPNATGACAMGRCGLACNAGFADCDVNPANGCETDTRTSVAHCGACGSVCSPANASASCVGGACRAVCNAGFGDCDMNQGTGCETDTRTSVAHCGACGRACSRTNTNNSCVAGACRVVNCEGTYGNCDANDTNGCETEIFTNNQHCGACGFVCNAAGRTCNSGRCAMPSSFGYVIATAPTTVAWVDACNTVGMTRYMQGQDDSYVGGSLPFPVDFWGGLTNQYLLGSNGLVGFGTFYGGLFTSSGQVIVPRAGRYGSFGTLPTFNGGLYQAPAPAIYALGVDLFLGATGVCVATVGTAPNRRWVAETYDAQIYMRTNVHLTFEVVANETPNNVFDVLYNTPWQTPDGTPFLATDVTVGTQDFRVVAASLRADQYNVGVTPTTRLRFTPR